MFTKGAVKLVMEAEPSWGRYSAQREQHEQRYSHETAWHMVQQELKV